MLVYTVQNYRGEKEELKISQKTVMPSVRVGAVRELQLPSQMEVS